MSIETNVAEKSRFHNDKKIWAIFRSILEYDRPQGTKYKGSQSIFTIAV